MNSNIIENVNDIIDSNDENDVNEESSLFGLATRGSKSSFINIFPIKYTYPDNSEVKVWPSTPKDNDFYSTLGRFALINTKEFAIDEGPISYLIKNFDSDLVDNWINGASKFLTLYSTYGYSGNSNADYNAYMPIGFKDFLINFGIKDVFSTCIWQYASYGINSWDVWWIDKDDNFFRLVWPNGNVPVSFNVNGAQGTYFIPDRLKGTSVIGMKASTNVIGPYKVNQSTDNINGNLTFFNPSSQSPDTNLLYDGLQVGVIMPLFNGSLYTRTDLNSENSSIIWYPTYYGYGSQQVDNDMGFVMMLNLRNIIKLALRRVNISLSDIEYKILVNFINSCYPISVLCPRGIVDFNAIIDEVANLINSSYNSSSITAQYTNTSMALLQVSKVIQRSVNLMSLVDWQSAVYLYYTVNSSFNFNAVTSLPPYVDNWAKYMPPISFYNVHTARSNNNKTSVLPGRTSGNSTFHIYDYDFVTPIYNYNRGFADVSYNIPVLNKIHHDKKLLVTESNGITIREDVYACTVTRDVDVTKNLLRLY